MKEMIPSLTFFFFLFSFLFFCVCDSDFTCRFADFSQGNMAIDAEVMKLIQEYVRQCQVQQYVSFLTAPRFKRPIQGRLENKLINVKPVGPNLIDSDRQFNSWVWFFLFWIM